MTGRVPGECGPPTPTRRSGASAFAWAVLLSLAGALVATPALRGQDAEPELPSLVLLDPSLSVRAATTSLQAASDGLYALEDRYLPLRFGDEDGIGSKIGGIGYRFARLTFLDAPMTGLHSVVRHEIAGHGGRVRQLGGDVRGYEIDLPAPYGAGGGAIRFELEDAGPVELAAASAAGLESALIDARGLEDRWVTRGRMDVREGLRYIYDLFEVVAYVSDAQPLGLREGHDVENYIAHVNASAPAGAPGRAVTSGRLEDAVAVELLNPTLYYALYAVLGRYLVVGDGEAPVPALDIGTVRVMPTIHLHLAPFGREYAAGVTAAWEGRVLRAGVRLGDGPRGRFGGLEIEGRRLHVGPRLRVGGRAGVWRQFDFEAGSTDTRVGGMAVVRATVPLRALPFSPVVELGAKSQGYAPGEALSAGVIWRVGGAFSF